MTDYELLKYAMITTALSAIGIVILEFLLWLCRKIDEEQKENKKIDEEQKKNKENKENKPKEKEPK